MIHHWTCHLTVTGWFVVFVNVVRVRSCSFGSGGELWLACSRTALFANCSFVFVRDLSFHEHRPLLAVGTASLLLNAAIGSGSTIGRR